jgi:tetratricopeptide (TPR) repeat protein
MKRLTSFHAGLFGLLLLFCAPAAWATPLDEAQSLISAGNYDRAIELLEQVVKDSTATAEVYNVLGNAYAWKKDYDNALKNYRVAAKLDKKYVTSPLPLLNQFERYDEIIRVGEAAVANGDKSPHVLTALLNAYFVTKNTRKYDRVVTLVKSQKYTNPEDIEYQKYILAKAALRADNKEGAMEYINLMSDKKFLQYMRTQPDFKPLYDDPRFIKKTE